MAERRRIRLAAVPYEEEEVEGDDNDGESIHSLRRVVYKDEGYAPTTEKPREQRVKITKQKSKPQRRKSRKKASRHKRKDSSGESTLMEELETTTWSLLKFGRKFIEKSIEEGKAQALKAAIRMRNDGNPSFEDEERSGRFSRRRGRKRYQPRKRRPSLHSTFSEDSRSMRSASSSYDSYSDSYGTFSYSDGEPSMSSSVCSSKSSKKRKSSKAKSNIIKADSSFGENSIVADGSYTTKDSATSEDDHSVLSGAWSKIDKSVDKPSIDQAEETEPRGGATKMEFLLEPDSSDSWIESMQTDSIGSFSSALNQELSYHRQVPHSTASMEPIQRRNDEISDISSKKGHQRKPTTELSDAEFLKVIRETVDQELGATEAESEQDFMAIMDQPAVGQGPSPTISGPGISAAEILQGIQQNNCSSPTETTLSNADFLKAMQQENGVNDKPDHLAASTEPLLSNTDFLEAIQQENGVEEGDTKTTEPKLSNADFLKAMQQENGVDDPADDPAAESILSNADFQQNGVTESTKESHISEPTAVLSDELSNADFLEAMKLSLSATGGKFEQEPDVEYSLSTEANTGVHSYTEDEQQGFSNADFLQVLQQTGAGDDDALNENKTSVQMDPNTHFFSALKQMGALEPEPSIYSHGKLATIIEVDSPKPSPPGSYSITEEDAVVVMDCDGSLSDIKQTAPGTVIKCDDSSVSQGGQLQSTHETVLDCDESFEDSVSTKQETLPEVIMDCDEESLVENVPLVKQQIEPDDNVELIDDASGREAISIKPTELPDLKCVSSEESENDVDDSDTGFMTADDILAEDDTDFFSMLTEQHKEETSQCDSLDDVLGGTKAPDGEDNAESRQDDQRQVESLEGVRRDDIEERKVLIRAIEVDETLTAEEKRLLIDDIENGVSIGPSLSCATSISETQSVSRTEINKAIGKKVMQGWTLLNSSCLQCMLPLMTDAKAVKATCIFCDYSRSMKGANLSALPPPPPPPMSSKKSQRNRAKREMGTLSCKHPNSLVVGSE